MELLLHSRLGTGYVRRMEVPSDFRVTLPQPLEAYLSGKETMDATEGGYWLRMSGGPLTGEAVVRVDRSEDGRFLVTGVVLGLRSRREITWEALRNVRPTTLVSYLFAGFDPANPLQQYAETDLWLSEEVDGDDFDVEAWERDAGDDDPVVQLSSVEWRTHVRAMAAYRLWVETSEAQRRDGNVAQPATKPRASVATDLVHFAEVYRRHQATTPRRATKATADELHVSRATVIRRVAECRQLGLLQITGAGK